MNAILRHFTLRLWATALVGGLICTVLLPQWQRIAGLSLLPLPVTVVLIGCFLLFGWMMNRLGLTVIRRQVAEAAVWERAGMGAEAEAAFERAKSAYDSFWLSPVQRRRTASWITMRLARFYLVQPALSQQGRSMVMSYLYLCPDDDAVALGWLEAALHRESHSREDHELATRIGEALRDNDKIQRLLMQFYLANRRADFEAMQTYRKVWARHGELPDSLIRELARMLLAESYMDDWALQVYLKAYSLGESGSLEGIAAGLQLLRTNADNRKYLDFAKEVMSGLDQAKRRSLIQKFRPPVARSDRTVERERDRSFAVAGRGIASLGLRVWRGLLGMLGPFRPSVRVLEKHWQQSPKFRRAALFVAIVTVAGVLAAAGWHMVGYAPKPPPTPAPVAQTAPPPVVDPFTIQVAAYLKPEDAQRFVDRLIQQKIDAFWTKAVSANRTWYQVKVSHFATKEAAGKYGEMLKSRGLIDDFYVANYGQ